ncbi:uncharacterized protein [Coffea arabica]|uniref:RNase H type-1 domain-containing protein n=1 Tax=Coffea arabica TaxID=13443 RepID=A0ABM4VQJ2_COFAR
MVFQMMRPVAYVGCILKLFTTYSFTALIVRGVKPKDLLRKLSFCTAVYFIWQERNNRLFQQGTKPPTALAQTIIDQVQKGRNCEVKDNLSNRSLAAKWGLQAAFFRPTIFWCKWEAPKPGIKWLNCDGSVRGDIGGEGFVLRDENGDILAARSIGVCTDSILIHELEAIKEALVFAKLKGWKCVEIRTNSKLSADILNSKSDCPWRALVAYYDIKDLISCFKELTIYFVYRQCNQVVDFMVGYLNRVDKVIFESKFPADLL